MFEVIYFDIWVILVLIVCLFFNELLFLDGGYKIEFIIFFFLV